MLGTLWLFRALIKSSQGGSFNFFRKVIVSDSNRGLFEKEVNVGNRSHDFRGKAFNQSSPARVSLGNGSWIVLKDGGDNLFVGNETKMVISGFVGYSNDVHRMSPYWV